MFALFVSTFLLVPPSGQDELQAVVATYDGQAGGIYYFVDMEGSSYVFNNIDSEAKAKYDLDHGTYEGKKFTVVYRILYPSKDDKEDEDNYGECIIVALSPM